MKNQIVLTLTTSLFLGACGQAGHQANELPVNSKSDKEKLSSPAPVTPVKNYAAARFLEHASFGPTPASISELKSLGMSAWIDQQFAAPTSVMDGTFTENWDSNDTPGLLARPYHDHATKSFMNFAMSSPDQLRLRMTWTLSQFIVVSELKVQSFAITQYFNTLQNHAFGNFADLLRAISVSSPMGIFLDNNSNKKEGSCSTCSVNENFARELMQLFTLGVVKLNPDGTAIRDANGKLIETYSQDDVQAMARALTGWDMIDAKKAPPYLLRSAYRYPMQTNWKESHDTGEKKLLGQIIPAGGSAEQDLERVIQILMNHPNLAPFVSTRLIQHFVTSDPSPAYVKRVVSVFENNGNGVKGDLKAVLRAILLDEEARRADDPAYPETRVGKIREPALFKLNLYRGIGCKQSIVLPDGGIDTIGGQKPFNPLSVFGFVSPTHRAPGSMLLSPEQKLLTASEFSNRLGGISWVANELPQNIKTAGCNFDEFVDAYKKSKRDYINLISARYFRGVMSPPMRVMAERVYDRIDWGTPESRAAIVLQTILTTPAFGVIK